LAPAPAPPGAAGVVGTVVLISSRGLSKPQCVTAGAAAMSTVTGMP
jgi:hypothetical protein